MNGVRYVSRDGVLGFSHLARLLPPRDGRAVRRVRRVGRAGVRRRYFVARLPPDRHEPRELRLAVVWVGFGAATSSWFERGSEDEGEAACHPQAPKIRGALRPSGEDAHHPSRY